MGRQSKKIKKQQQHSKEKRSVIMDSFENASCWEYVDNSKVSYSIVIDSIRQVMRTLCMRENILSIKGIPAVNFCKRNILFDDVTINTGSKYLTSRITLATDLDDLDDILKFDELSEKYNLVELKDILPEEYHDLCITLAYASLKIGSEKDSETLEFVLPVYLVPSKKFLIPAKKIGIRSNKRPHIEKLSGNMITNAVLILADSLAIWYVLFIMSVFDKSFKDHINEISSCEKSVTTDNTSETLSNDKDVDVNNSTKTIHLNSDLIKRIVGCLDNGFGNSFKNELVKRLEVFEGVKRALDGVVDTTQIGDDEFLDSFARKQITFNANDDDNYISETINDVVKELISSGGGGLIDVSFNKDDISMLDEHDKSTVVDVTDSASINNGLSNESDVEEHANNSDILADNNCLSGTNSGVDVKFENEDEDNSHISCSTSVKSKVKSVKQKKSKVKYKKKTNEFSVADRTDVENESIVDKVDNISMTDNVSDHEAKTKAMEEASDDKLRNNSSNYYYDDIVDLLDRL